MELQSLMDILETFVEDTNNHRSNILKIETFFKAFIKNRDANLKNVSISTDPEFTNSTGKISQIESMHNIAFQMTWKIIIESICRGKVESRLQALNTTTRLLKTQAKLVASHKRTSYYFPEQMLKEILLQLLSSDNNNSLLIESFQDSTVNNDLLFYCWKLLPSLTCIETPNDVYINNYFDLINVLPLKKDQKGAIKMDEDEIEKPKLLCEIKGGPRFRFDLTRVQRSMEECWKRVNNWKMNNTCLQRALLVLLDHLIPHLPKPVLLTDFLMNAMDAGGANSALALQGVFTLMQKHNLEYPLVYKKIYSMYEPDMFFTKHKSRLFYLTNIFLGSTHLPESLVAGFAKKFSRLALVVPPTDAIVLLHMTSNLIIRHPGLAKMIDAGVSKSEFTSDPYDINEPDPSLSGALQSSLWEVADLKQHVYPTVAAAAASTMVSHQTTIEKQITEFLDDTPDDLIEAEFKKKYKNVFLTTKQPTSIADSTEDRLMQFWQIF